MKESYIKDKVVKLMNWSKKGPNSCERMAKDREIASIGNKISQEYARASAEFERHMTSFIHHTLKDQLK